MAVYYCHSCDNYLDGDYHPMEESELCPECHAEKEESLTKDNGETK